MPAERNFYRMQTENNMKDLLKYITSIGENDYFSHCHVTMPKFKFDFDYDNLKEHLQSLGILSFRIIKIKLLLIHINLKILVL